MKTLNRRFTGIPRISVPRESIREIGVHLRFSFFEHG